MDAEASAALARLLRSERIAALGTLRSGAPLVSLVSFLAAPDFSAFTLRVSRLAWHTQDIEREPQVSLLIAEADDRRADPQTLARATVRGSAVRLAAAGAEHERLKAAWLERFPEAAVTFELADFSFWRVAPHEARFVAGLGQTYNLSAAALRAAAAS
jgi:putative heme iron utilization protein